MIQFKNLQEDCVRQLVDLWSSFFYEYHIYSDPYFYIDKYLYFYRQKSSI